LNKSRSRRVCVLGTGSAGLKHLQAFRTAGVDPIAVPLRSSRRAQLRALGFATAAGLEEAARLGAAACVVATDTGRHAADAVAAARLGMDLLVEKPLATDAGQARRCADAVRRAGRRAFVACVMRFSDSLAEFRAALPRLGRLHAVEIECRSYLPDWRPQRPYRRAYSARADEGGALRDLVHEIDYAGWLFGFPEAVCGRTLNTGRLRIAAEEAAELLWAAKGGPSVAIGLDYLTRPARRRMTAFGERGTLEWDCLAEATTLTLAGGKPRRLRRPQTVSHRFAAQARAFLAALAGRSDERLATLADGISALAVCDAVRRGQRCVPSKI